jgi:hypothetical protein
MLWWSWQQVIQTIGKDSPKHLGAEPVGIGNTLLSECCASCLLLTLHMCKATLRRLVHVSRCEDIMVQLCCLSGDAAQKQQGQQHQQMLAAI